MNDIGWLAVLERLRRFLTRQWITKIVQNKIMDVANHNMFDGEKCSSTKSFDSSFWRALLILLNSLLKDSSSSRFVWGSSIVFISVSAIVVESYAWNGWLYSWWQ